MYTFILHVVLNVHVAAALHLQQFYTDVPPPPLMWCLLNDIFERLLKYSCEYSLQQNLVSSKQYSHFKILIALLFTVMTAEMYIASSPYQMGTALISGAPASHKADFHWEIRKIVFHSPIAGHFQNGGGNWREENSMLTLDSHTQGRWIYSHFMGCLTFAITTCCQVADNSWERSCPAHKESLGTGRCYFKVLLYKAPKFSATGRCRKRCQQGLPRPQIDIPKS